MTVRKSQKAFTIKQRQLCLFTEIEEFEYEGKPVITIYVEADGKKYTTTDGRCLKRLGRNSKPMYPKELSNVYSFVQNSDFSERIISESTLDDVNKLEVYSLKEKLRVRDSKSTLQDLITGKGVITND